VLPIEQKTDAVFVLGLRSNKMGKQLLPGLKPKVANMKTCLGIMGLYQCLIGLGKRGITRVVY
jgi:hypothetical protein